MPMRRRCAGWRCWRAGLPRVKADPSDLQARLDCQLGSWLSMGPLASGVPMGASHGIGYVLGAVFDIPHGHTSCIMLPAVMRWNKSVNAEKSGAGRGGDGPSGRGCRRCAGRVHRGAWHAAESECGECRGGCVRPDGGTGDGHAMGAAQSAAHRWAGAGEGDFGTGGVTRGDLMGFAVWRYPSYVRAAQPGQVCHYEERSDAAISIAVRNGMGIASLRSQ